jgi:hypothetical protein
MASVDLDSAPDSFCHRCCWWHIQLLEPNHPIVSLWECELCSPDQPAKRKDAV